MWGTIRARNAMRMYYRQALKNEDVCGTIRARNAIEVNVERVTRNHKNLQ